MISIAQCSAAGNLLLGMICEDIKHTSSSSSEKIKHIMGNGVANGGW